MREGSKAWRGAFKSKLSNRDLNLSHSPKQDLNFHQDQMEPHSTWDRQRGRRLRRSATLGVALRQPYIMDSSSEESASDTGSPLQNPPTSYLGLDLKDPENKTIITTTDKDIVGPIQPSSVKVDEWATCRLMFCKGERFILCTAEGTYLNGTLLTDDEEELFDISFEGGETIRTPKENRWVVLKAIPRARELYELGLLQPRAQKRKRTQTNLHTVLSVDVSPLLSSENGAQRNEARASLRRQKVGGAFTGYSVYMKGPSFVRPPRTNLKDETRTHVRMYDFRGNEFKREPGGHLNGGLTLVHYKVCTRANFIALKVLASGETVGSVFKHGDKPLLEYVTAINQSANSASLGHAITPVALFDEPDPSRFMEMARHPHATYIPTATQNVALMLTEVNDGNPDRPRPRYPTNKEMLCNGALLSRDLREIEGPAGFTFEVPYLLLMEYPRELTALLRNFADCFRQDALSMKIMLLAVTIWIDIMRAPLRKREVCVRENRGTEIFEVPEVRLASFIIYLPHLLRWTEIMGLTEYPHPFRFVYQALLKDHQKVALVVDHHLVDEKRVMELMDQVRSKVPGVEPHSRKALLPHMFPGSRMPRMINVEPYSMPGQAEMAALGLPNIKFIGFPDYNRVKRTGTQDYVRLVVPKVLAEQYSAIDYEELSLSQDLEQNLESLDHQTPTLVCLPALKGGMEWEDIPDGFDEPLSPQLDHTTGREPFDMRLHMLPMAQYSFSENSAWHMSYLINQGHLSINPNSTIRLNSQGMWVADGQPPMPNLYRVKYPTLYFSGRSQQTILPPSSTYYSHQEDPTALGFQYEEENSVGPSALLEELEVLLASKPEVTHWAWENIHTKLAEADKGTITPETLRGMLEDAIAEESADWSTFQEASEMIPNSERPRQWVGGATSAISSLKAVILAAIRLCGGTVGEEAMDGIANWESIRALRDHLKEVARALGTDEAEKVGSLIDMLSLSVEAAAPSKLLIQLLPGLHDEAKDILKPLQLRERALALLESVD